MTLITTAIIIGTLAGTGLIDETTAILAMIAVMAGAVIDTLTQRRG